jgi:cbb3-type cytochrome oxidase subunit 1
METSSGGRFDRGTVPERECGGEILQGVARNFFILAIIYAICGMILGLAMAISHDHSQMPVHAHAMVAGWLMSAVFAFFYHLFPAANASRLAPVHFWLTAISGIALLVSLFFLLGGNPAIEPMTAMSSIGFFIAMGLFVWIALPAIGVPGTKPITQAMRSESPTSS